MQTFPLDLELRREVGLVEVVLLVHFSGDRVQGGARVDSLGDEEGRLTSMKEGSLLSGLSRPMVLEKFGALTLFQSEEVR